MLRADFSRVSKAFPPPSSSCTCDLHLGIQSLFKQTTTTRERGRSDQGSPVKTVLSLLMVGSVCPFAALLFFLLLILRSSILAFSKFGRRRANEPHFWGGGNLRLVTGFFGNCFFSLRFAKSLPFVQYKHKTGTQNSWISGSGKLY